MHAKHQEKMTHYRGKNELKPINETDTEMTHMLELAVKNTNYYKIVFHVFKNSRSDQDIIKDNISGDENYKVQDEKYSEL